MPTDDFFRARIDQMIDLSHPLAVLARRMPWESLEKALAPTFAHKDRKGRSVPGHDLFGPTLEVAGAGVSPAGRPRFAIRLMVSLLYLKHAFNLSDEALVERWSENVLWQYFVGPAKSNPVRFQSNLRPVSAHWTGLCQQTAIAKHPSQDRRLGGKPGLIGFCRADYLDIQMLDTKDLMSSSHDHSVEESEVSSHRRTFASVPQVSTWALRFWTIYIGQALSLLGSSLTQFVLIWWVTVKAGSVAELGVAGMAALLPQALLGPIGGVFADRHNRQLIMILSDMVSMACMVALIALFTLNRAEVWHVYVMMFIRSAMQAFQQPALTASISMLVPRDFLSRAAGLNQTVAGLITIGAAPLGAMVLGIMPIGWALYIDAITAVFAIGPLLFLVIPQVRTDRALRRSIWHEFRAGIDVVWQSHAMLHLYALITIAVLVIMPMPVLLPLLVKDYFHGGPSELATMQSLLGVGMIIGGIAITAITPRRQVPWVLSGFALSCLCIALAAWTPARLFWLATVFWTVSAVFSSVGNATFMGFLQGTIPNELQGRAISLLTTLMGLASPVGLAVATPLGEAIGVRWLFVVLGLAGATILLAGFLSRPLRQAPQINP